MARSIERPSLAARCPGRGRRGASPGRAPPDAEAVVRSSPGRGPRTRPRPGPLDPDPVAGGAGPGRGVPAGRAAIAAQAETVARSITDPFPRARALAEVAGALARAGQHQQGAAIAAQAETVARSITDPRSQARALAEIARALAGCGEARSAAQVTSALCAIGRWPIAVKPVLLLAPSASMTLARMLEQQLAACLRTFRPGASRIVAGPLRGKPAGANPAMSRQ